MLTKGHGLWIESVIELSRPTGNAKHRKDGGLLTNSAAPLKVTVISSEREKVYSTLLDWTEKVLRPFGVSFPMLSSISYGHDVRFGFAAALAKQSWASKVVVSGDYFHIQKDARDQIPKKAIGPSKIRKKETELAINLLRHCRECPAPHVVQEVCNRKLPGFQRSVAWYLHSHEIRALQIVSNNNGETVYRRKNMPPLGQHPVLSAVDQHQQPLMPIWVSSPLVRRPVSSSGTACCESGNSKLQKRWDEKSNPKKVGILQYVSRSSRECFDALRRRPKILVKPNNHILAGYSRVPYDADSDEWLLLDSDGDPIESESEATPSGVEYVLPTGASVTFPSFYYVARRRPPTNSAIEDQEADVQEDTEQDGEDFYNYDEEDEDDSSAIDYDQMSLGEAGSIMVRSFVKFHERQNVVHGAVHYKLWRRFSLVCHWERLFEAWGVTVADPPVADPRHPRGSLCFCRNFYLYGNCFCVYRLMARLCPEAYVGLVTHNKRGRKKKEVKEAEERALKKQRKP